MAKIIEINKLLSGISALTRDNRSINKKFVEAKYNDNYFSDIVSSFDEIFSQSVSMGFVINDANDISLSKYGKYFVDLSIVKDDQRILDFNKQQREFFYEILVNLKNFQNIYSKIFAKFRTNHLAEPPFWHASVRSFTRSEIMWIDLLQELGIIHKTQDTFQIHVKYSTIVSALRNKISITLQELEDKLKRQKETGEQGEQLTLAYEIKRLSGLDKSGELADQISQISKNDVFAGYDIISFDDQNSKEHDRFIEVKSTIRSFPSFFWSRNEVDKARELDNKYWVYLWTDVNDPQKRDLLIIQNPYKLFFTGKIKPEPVEYLIGDKLLNDLIIKNHMEL